MPSDKPPHHPDDPDAEDVIAGRTPGTAVLRGQAGPTTAVAAGGALGALVRWFLETAYPAAPDTFPTTTFVINVVGCLLMGVLVVLVTEARDTHPAVRPFLGVGVLGGFTTFSTYAVEAHQLLTDGHLATAGLYLGLTVVTALLAVVLGLVLARRASGLTGRRAVRREAS